MGETFFEAAVRKIRREVGVDVRGCKVLGTWNTPFEVSAWGGVTQTINVLVHAATNAEKELHICGDRKGRCANGRYGLYKWIDPAAGGAGEVTYIREGLSALCVQVLPTCDHGDLKPPWWAFGRPANVSAWILRDA